MVVYKIVNSVNDKIYVGQTIKTIDVRMSEHIKSALKGESGHLYNAMRLYGVDKFQIELIAIASDQSELDQLEDYYICLWDTIRNGYNMIRGGAHFAYGNPMYSEECKNRHDKAMRSEDVKSRIASTVKKYHKENYNGSVLTAARYKLSENKKRLYASPEGEIVKAKQRASFKFSNQHFESLRRSKYKPVYCVDRSGAVVASFECVRDASDWWYHVYRFQHYKPPLHDYIKKSNDQDIYINDLHWYYGEPCAESSES